MHTGVMALAALLVMSTLGLAHTGLKDGIKTGMDVAAKITRADGSTEDITLLCRIDTLDEVEYFRHGGILQFVLRKLMKEAA